MLGALFVWLKDRNFFLDNGLLSAYILMTHLYGRIKFQTSKEAHGLQMGYDMACTQWQKDQARNLVKEAAWPLEGATLEAIYPKP